MSSKLIMCEHCKEEFCRIMTPIIEKLLTSNNQISDTDVRED